MKYFLPTLFLLLAAFTASAQIDYFNVDGSWAGNDANGNAVIKWRITICSGQDSVDNLVVRVPALERDETQSGATGIADEDSPADDQVCAGAWSSSYNIYRPVDYQTTGVLLDMATPGVEFPRNTCRVYTWTSYSKDYDSSADDYDHYVTANYTSGSAPLANPGFDCNSLNGSDDFISCDNGNTNIGTPICMDQVDCDDVATNNYEQILGLAYDRTDGPNFQPDCAGGDYAFDFTYEYVVCHHGESDYDAGCDLTGPGEKGAVDILPDSVTNINLNNNIIQRLESRGATVTNFTLTNPGVNQYLVIDPLWDGDANQNMVLTTSVIPPGVDEMLDGNEPATNSVGCVDSQPECDTLELYIEWRPNDLTDMFNSSNEGFECDETGNINGGNAAGTNNLFNYFTQPRLTSYEPLNGYQNAGTTDALEGPPTEVAHRGLEPDPEYGDCDNSAFNTCSAGPAEDCSGVNLQMGYYAEIGLEKNTISVFPNFSNPNFFDVTFEIIFTNEGEVNLIDPVLEDDLVMTFGSSAAFFTPFVMPPTIDASVIPAPSIGGGFPMVNSGYNGDSDVEIFDGTGGIIEPGESVRLTFTVTVDRAVIGSSSYSNQAQVNAPDCFGMMSSDIWCVGDVDQSTIQILDLDIALAKTAVTPGPYTIGQTVTFNIEVINQGMVDLQNVEVTDYIPCGFALAPSSLPVWTLNGSNATANIADLPVGTSEDLTIDLIIQNCATGPNDWLNIAEVSYMEDEFGRDVSMVDFDSMADSNPNNDAGGAAGTGSDNSVTGDGMGAPGDGDAATDEDDMDVELIEIFDLALTKEINTTATPGPYTPGGTVQFTITVVNQGNVDAFDVDVADYNPTGLGDVTLVAGQTGVVQNAPNDFTVASVPAGTTSTFEVEAVIDPAFQGPALVNDAEITGGSATAGGPDALDADSTPGDNADPNDPNDNDVDASDGSDDQDPAPVTLTQTFDLALDKVIDATATPGPYTPGDDVTFTVTVYNQGSLNATNIIVEDYLPTGMSFVSSPDFALAGASYQATIPALAGGASQTLSITLMIDNNFQGTALTNNAEVISGTNVLGIADQDNDLAVQHGSSDDVSELDTNNDVDDDGVGTPGTVDNPADIDDYDPEQVMIGQTFDLALVKTLSPSTVTPIVPGGTVTFLIEVFNQGTIDAFNVQVNDYIPAGLTLADPNWNVSMGTASLINEIPQIDAGDSEVVTITFTVDSDFMGSSITNDAEIQSAEDENGDPVTDVDSTPGDNADPNDPNNDDTAATDGSDDQDPETIMIGQIFDLALTKSINTAATPPPYGPGSTVQFTITIVNQGTLDAFDVDVADYNPAGLGDATLVAGQTGVVQNAPNDFTVATVAAGTTRTFEVEATIDAAFMGSSLINDAEITGGSDTPGGPDVTDVDSTPGDNADPNDPNDDDVDATDGSDDQDPAEIMIGQVFDLALIKTFASSSVTPIVPGATVTFDITVFNQGSLDAFNINVNDYTPAGLTLTDPNWTQVGPVADLNTPIAFIAAGDDATVSVTYTVDADFMGSSITNNAEISSADDDNDPTNTPPTDVDSTPDSEDGSVPDPNDDDTTDTNGNDDYDPATIPIAQTFDLALVKTLSPATVTPIVPGGTVTFLIEVFNQGTVDAFNVQVNDYIPTGLTLADPNWNVSMGTASLINEIPRIDAGESEVVAITFTVDSDFMGTSITNDAEIESAEDENGDPVTDVDSTPGDNADPNDPNNDDTAATDGSDDQDPATIMIGQTFDLALTKMINTAATPPPYGPGSTVQFTITIVNQGTLDAFDVDVADYNPAGLGDATLVAGQMGVVQNAPNDFTVATVAAGTTRTFEVEATIDAAFMGSSLINDAEITGGSETPGGPDATDVDSTPGDNADPNDPNDDDVDATDGSDDQDPAEIMIGQVFDLALIKTFASSSVTPIVPGATVTFDITVFNQGSLDAFNINVNDYTPAGLTLTDPNWTQVGPVADLNTPIAFIASGDDATVSVTYTVDADFMGSSITNNAEISSADDDNDPTNTPPTDIDSTPDSEDGTVPDPNDDDTTDTNGNDDYDPATIPVAQTFDLALVKTVSPATVTPIVPGGTVTFLIEVFNQGTVDAFNVQVNDYVPAGLTLADPTWNESAGVATLINEIPRIDVGESEVVTITFTVDSDFMGTTIVNDAEIESAEDVDGDPATDVDSTPGDNADPNDPNDDDTAATDGSDDQDPADITIVQTFDLALTKTLNTIATPPPYAGGSTVQFTISVVNQGTLDAFDVDVADYNPTGLGDATLVAGQTGVVENAPNDFTVASVPAGTTVTFEVEATIDAGFMGSSLINDAEITGGSETPGGPDATDVDSTPGDNADPNDPNDNDVDATDGSDDQDPALIPIGQTFDLALVKMFASSSVTPIVPGATVTFDITVFNQGSLDAFNINVNDYTPAGVTLTDPNWTQVGPVADLNTPIAFIAAGDDATVSVTYTVNADFQGTSITNNAEISSADDDNDPTNTPPTDIDSTPDSEDGSVPDPNDNDTTDTNGNDDYDPATIPVVQTFDLALVKTVSPATVTPIVPGGTVTFLIEVFNQGTVDAFNVQVNDYVPAGLTLADPTWNESAGVATLINEIPRIDVGESEVVTITFTVDSDFMGTTIVNDAEIESAEDVNGDPATDVDSTPGDNADPNDPNDDDTAATDGSDDQDPADITIVQTFDLALTKTLNTIATPPPYAGGSTVQFTISVVNQGTLDAFDVDVADYNPTGLGAATLVAGQTGVVENAPNDFTVASVPAGTTVTFEVEATIDAGFMGSSLINDAEITGGSETPGGPDATDVDSTPGDNADPNDPNDNDVDATDGSDDQDPALVPVGQVFDLALIKTFASSSVTPIVPGATVTYDITVFNQGSLDAFNININDYTPEGLTLNDPNWSPNGVVADLDAPIAFIAAGDDATVSITFTVDADFMGTSITNNAEISNADDDNDPTNTPPTDIDSTPDTEDGSVPDPNDDDTTDTNGNDDYDPATIPVVQTFDLALVKTVSPVTVTPVIPGGTVTFLIEVFNQGTVDAFNIQVNDYVPAGLTLSDPTWNETAGVATLNNEIPRIDAGESEVVSITFTVDSDFMGTSIVNDAEIESAEDVNGDPATDVDSTPGDNADPNDPNDDDTAATDGSDDQDPAEVGIMQEFDLALDKAFDSWDDTDMNGMVDPGENVTFRINVYNQGTLDATAIEVVDYVATGMIFNQADNTDFTSAAPGSATEPVATIASLDMGEETALFITLQIDPAFMGSQVINNAEITDATNALGLDDEDGPLSVIDGSADDSSELGTDDDIDDEFPGTPGTEDNDEDADDYDPAFVAIGQMFDLALVKTYDSYNDLSGDGVLSPGDEVTFNTRVFNQGTLDAFNIQITDYIPEGLSLADPDWNNTQNVALAQLNNVIPFLAVGDDIEVPITFTIDEFFRGNSIVNFAEISSADDNDDPTDGFPDDVDSNPNTTNGDDIFGGDNVIDNTNNDEDDSDPAEINPVVDFDLALAKVDQSDVPPANYGDTRTFDFQVTNQGTVLATEFTVVDYIPCGLEFIPGAANPGWTYNPVSRIAEFIYDEDLLRPTEMVTVSITLTVVDCPGDPTVNYTNFGEISDYDDDFNDFNQEVPDVDSDADATNFDDPGGVADSPTDNVIDGDGSGALGSNDPATDEDDHDPEIVEIFDLALTKGVSDATPGPYAYGSAITFDIEVINQGNIGAQNVVVTDYLPAGYSFDAAVNPGWTGTAPNVSFTITDVIPVGGSQTVSITLEIVQTDGGEKDWINYSEITSAENDRGEDRTDFDIDSNAGSNNADENGVEPGDDLDDDVDSDDKGGEEDDHDPAGIEIYDLAQVKTTTATAPFSYGDVVPYTITVYNQGSIASSGIEITDFLPCGLGYSATNDANGWSHDVAASTATVTIPGVLAPGETTAVTIDLIVQQCIDMDDTSFTNVAEITNSVSEDPDEPADDFDSTEDNDPTNDPTVDDEFNNNGGDEDDNDPERIDIFDLAQIKTLVTPAPYSYGDVFEFEFTVCNQGNVEAQSIEVTDYVPAGYGFDAAANAGWTLNGTDVVYAVPGVLAADECTTFSLFLTFQMTTGGQEDWINYSEITNADDDDDATNAAPVDADSTPGSDTDEENAIQPDEDGDDDLTSVDPDGNQDDHDPAGIEVFDLAQIKQETSVGPYAFGDVVTFDLTVFNQGSIPATDVVLTDYIPCGYLFEASSNAGWTADGDAASTTIAGPIMPGMSMTRTITLTLQQCFDEDAWVNVSEISAATNDDTGEPGDDVDSDSDTDPTNDGDPIDDDVDGSGEGDCSDCIQTVVVPLAGVEPIVVDEVFVDGAILALPNYPYDLRDPAQAQQFLADCIALGYDVVESVDPATQELSISVRYPGQSFDSFSINGGEEFFFTCSECIVSPDEDDSDPAVVDLFDLALIKFIDDKGPYDEGEIANYVIRVYNQGNVHAYNVQVTDYINIGYTFEPENNIGWTLTGDLAQTTIVGPIAPGDSVELTLALEVAVPANASAGSWYNEAEISFADNDLDPTNGTPLDADSTPDTDPDNDNDLVDGPDEDIIFDEEDDNDNVIDENPNDPFGLGDDDEDDNDAAEIIVVGGLGDLVFKDLNGNGIQDAGEPGVAGVVATLTDCMGNVLATETTDADGFYFFNNLIPGDYQISFDISALPEGCAFTQQDQGGDDELDSDVDINGVGPCTTIQGGDFDSTYDAGLLVLVDIGDFVWHDLDGDGVQDAGEPGLAGVDVFLFDADGNVLEMTTTDANGNYLFENLYPGDYYIAFEDPEDFELTFADNGGDLVDSDVTNSIPSSFGSTTDIFTIEFGQDDDLSFDAGYFMCVPIGQYVWYDVDEDDIRDFTENGINGLQVNLYRRVNGTFELWDTYTTGLQPGTPSTDGYFKFCAPPGEYYVGIDLPPYGLVPANENVFGFVPLNTPGEQFTDSDLNRNGRTPNFTVRSGDDVCTIGAGYYPMATAGNLVWFDANANGRQDVSEPTVPDVVVELIDMTTSEVVEQTVTNNAGIYGFEQLQARDYYMRFTPPSGYTFTAPNSGDEAMDSDVDNTYGARTTSARTFVPGGDNPNIDAGLVAGVLPVEWLDFTARTQDDGTHLLRWATAQEVNASHFEVERSIDGDEWTTLGEVKAAGTSAEEQWYSYQDADTETAGEYTYRIKQLDVDGTADYSVERSLLVEQEKGFAVYPNPTSGDITVDYEVSGRGEVSVDILDITGALLRSQVFSDDADAGLYSESLDMSMYPPGIYTVRINLPSESLHTNVILVK